jgi:hypothetical protein
VKDIPKPTLMSRLREESSAFMRTLMEMTLPAHCGRMRLCAIETANKRAAEEMNQDSLLQFLTEFGEHSVGDSVRFSEVYERFINWLPIDERSQWSQKKVSKRLPDNYPRERDGKNMVMIANLKWRVQ